jgi:HEAT repeat protein
MAKRRGCGCLGRLLGLVLAGALVAAPIWLMLPDEAVGQVLAWIYPSGGLNLADPELIETWKAILAGGGGLAAALLLALLMALARAGRRAGAEPVPPALKRLKRAVAGGRPEAIVAAAEEAAAGLGAEAVEHLLTALQGGLPEEARQAVAAALYRIGRAVTAEVELHPRR